MYAKSIVFLPKSNDRFGLNTMDWLTTKCPCTHEPCAFVYEKVRHLFQNKVSFPFKFQPF